MVAAWDIYAQELLHLRHGYPLWSPEPCPDAGEVRLGDVGYLRDGYFCFLFNAMRSAEDPVNARIGVPPGFVSFNPPKPMITRRPNHITQTQLHSKSLRSLCISTAASATEAGASATAGLRYECGEDSGALLMLKRPAHKTSIDCRMHIEKYIRANISSWCDFANECLGLGLDEKDIIFVSGTTKTSLWAEAAFRNSSSRGELVIAGGCFVPSVSGEFRVSMTRAVDPSVFSRAGPFDRLSTWNEEDRAVEKDDQCIFLNFYKFKRRRFWPSILEAAGGYHQLPGEDPHDDTSSDLWQSESVCSDDESDMRAPDYDPVDCLLDYILEHSDAAFAIACDDDLARVLGGQRMQDDVQGMLAAISPQISVDEHGCGTVALTDDSGTRLIDHSLPAESVEGKSSLVTTCSITSGHDDLQVGFNPFTSDSDSKSILASDDSHQSIQSLSIGTQETLTDISASLPYDYYPSASHPLFAHCSHSEVQIGNHRHLGHIMDHATHYARPSMSRRPEKPIADQSLDSLLQRDSDGYLNRQPPSHPVTWQQSGVAGSMRKRAAQHPWDIRRSADNPNSTASHRPVGQPASNHPRATTHAELPGETDSTSDVETKGRTVTLHADIATLSPDILDGKNNAFPQLQSLSLDDTTLHDPGETAEQSDIRVVRSPHLLSRTAPHVLLAGEEDTSMDIPSTSTTAACMDSYPNSLSSALSTKSVSPGVQSTFTPVPEDVDHSPHMCPNWPAGGHVDLALIPLARPFPTPGVVKEFRMDGVLGVPVHGVLNGTVTLDDAEERVFEGTGVREIRFAIPRLRVFESEHIDARQACFIQSGSECISRGHLANLVCAKLACENIDSFHAMTIYVHGHGTSSDSVARDPQEGGSQKKSWLERWNVGDMEDLWLLCIAPTAQSDVWVAEFGTREGPSQAESQHTQSGKKSTSNSHNVKSLRDTPRER